VSSAHVHRCLSSQTNPSKCDGSDLGREPGRLFGAWLGASWAVRMRTATLYRVLAAMHVLIVAALVGTHFGAVGSADLPPLLLVPVGVLAGFLIGTVAAVMGVAGGELLIPTIVLLFAVDVKLAGSLSLVVSLPTMLVAFARYSRDGSFVVLRDNMPLVARMTAGSIAGTLVGGLLLGVVDNRLLIPLLGLLLVVSAYKVWGHRHG